MNIGDLISKAVAEKLDSAFVEKEVETRIAKLVTEAVDQALRAYSDTGKKVREAVEEALRVDRLDLPSYGATVCAILKSQIEANVATLVSGQLAEDMEELLKLAPKEIRLSELAEEMIKDSHCDYGPAITVIVEPTEYSSTWLYLDETEHHEKTRDCRHRLLIGEDGKISGGWFSHRKMDDGRYIGASYGLEQRLRAFVACGTRIILDEDNVVTSVGDY